MKTQETRANATQQQVPAQAARLPARETAQSETGPDLQGAQPDNRPAAFGLRQYQAMVNRSPRVQGIAQLRTIIRNSPRMVAQPREHQASLGNAVQFQSGLEEEKLLQGKPATTQLKKSEVEEFQLKQKTTPTQEAQAQLRPDPVPSQNDTGLPDNLKAGIETLSGDSPNHLKIHYNSSRPARFQAHAYTQGDGIHIPPGQERHLPHEAWNVVQQAQRWVKPTLLMKRGHAVNDCTRQEHEADAMEAQAKRVGSASYQTERDGPVGKTLMQVGAQLPASHAVATPAPLQLRVDQTFAQYVGDRGINQKTVEEYYIVIKPELQEALGKFGNDDIMPAHRALVELNINYLAAYGKARHDGSWPTVAKAVDKLVVAINEFLEFSGQNDEFSNLRSDSWKTAGHAIMAMQGAVDKKQIGKMKPKRRRGDQHPDAPQIGWQLASQVMPTAQKDLVLAIYLSWKYGKVFDQRTEKEKKALTKNSEKAGALRSWHMNEQAQLPDIKDKVVPSNATKLHEHYNNTSMKPYDEPAEGPIGYAEYTGTGILNDTHYSKIVLDYKSGLIYMTLSHYGLWNKPTLEDPNPIIGDKQAGTGSQSAWFCIDMNQ